MRTGPITLNTVGFALGFWIGNFLFGMHNPEIVAAFVVLAIVNGFADLLAILVRKLRRPA